MQNIRRLRAHLDMFNILHKFPLLFDSRYHQPEQPRHRKLPNSRISPLQFSLPCHHIPTSKQSTSHSSSTPRLRTAGKLYGCSPCPEVKLYTSSSEFFAAMRGLYLSHAEWKRDLSDSFSGFCCATGVVGGRINWVHGFDGKR